jgi:hypothetical protein
MNNIKKKNIRIFLIGFNKCGTRTLHKFFMSNNIKSVHYDNGRIANSMWRHHKNKRPLIHDQYKDVVFFSDMENIYTPEGNLPIYIAPTLFKKLDRQYKNSKFILNTRTLNNWLESRIRHANGNYLKFVCKKYDLSEDTLIQKWIDDWNNHHKNVIEYFKNRSNDFLIYDIEKDSIEKIINFLKQEFYLNPKLYRKFGVTNKTTNDYKISENYQNLIKKYCK